MEINKMKGMTEITQSQPDYLEIYSEYTGELVFTYTREMVPEVIDCGHYFTVYYLGEYEQGKPCACQCDYPTNKYYYKQQTEIKKFQVGMIFRHSDIFTGGSTQEQVVDVTYNGNQKQLICKGYNHELDGDWKITNQYDVLTDEERKTEYIILWEYQGHQGIIYADNKTQVSMPE